eukprot:Amastigsp_a176028_145.p1 type:complete len:224 gc:universal Amastigsp_a176028_145:707-36(-)
MSSAQKRTRAAGVLASSSASQQASEATGTVSDGAQVSPAVEGSGRSTPVELTDEEAAAYSDSDSANDASLPSSLAPTTRRLLKFLREAEHELNRGPTEEELQWERDLQADRTVWGTLRRGAYNSFKAAEWMGGKIAGGLGLTAPMYGYYIDRAIEQREEERRRIEDELAASGAAVDAVEAGRVRGSAASGSSSAYTYEYETVSDAHGVSASDTKTAPARAARA